MVVTGQSEASSRLQHHILPKQRGDDIDNDMRTVTERKNVCEDEFFPRTRGSFSALARDARLCLAWARPERWSAVNPLTGVATLRGANGMWSIDATRRMVFPVSLQ